MKTNISVKILYFFRRSWLTQILRGPLREEFFTEIFYSWSALKWIRPMFESELRGTN